MGKKCYFCEKRKAKYPLIVYPYVGIEKEIEVCSFCFRKYKRMKDNALTKIYYSMIELIKEKK